MDGTKMKNKEKNTGKPFSKLEEEEEEFVVLEDNPLLTEVEDLQEESKKKNER